MIVLALDTCDSRGSLAVLRDDAVLWSIAHEGAADYSSWVLPKAEEALNASGLTMREADVIAVATGPGSFTGVRIGLTTVKAWSEAFGTAIAGVSRLQAVASHAAAGTDLVASFVDAHRDQVFGGVYRKDGKELLLVEQEMVAAPAEFLDWVNQRSAGKRIAWISIDPEKMTTLELWREQEAAGERVESCPPVLAPAIGKIGRQRALAGLLTDALALDAEYVRRPDAELFWKGGPSRGS